MSRPRGTFLRTVLLLLVGLTVVARGAAALSIVVDPDSYPSGTDISNAFPGVTLSAIGPGWSNPSGSVFSVDPSTHPTEPFTASTGTQSFGTDDGLYWHIFYVPGWLELRVDFALSAGQVTVDFISNNSADSGYLRAYDSGGSLLDTYTTASLSLNQVETATVSSGSYDIAYVLASGFGGGSSIGIDHLTAEVIPEPATILLLGGSVTALAVGRLKRRRQGS